MKAKMIGSINCFLKSNVRFGMKSASYDGTTVDLVRSAAALGAKAGDIVKADIGGDGQMSTYQIVAAPHDKRANSLWANRIAK